MPWLVGLGRRLAVARSRAARVTSSQYAGAGRRPSRSAPTAPRNGQSPEAVAAAAVMAWAVGQRRRRLRLRGRASGAAGADASQVTPCRAMPWLWRRPAPQSLAIAHHVPAWALERMHHIVRTYAHLPARHSVSKTQTHLRVRPWLAGVSAPAASTPSTRRAHCARSLWVRSTAIVLPARLGERGGSAQAMAMATPLGSQRGGGWRAAAGAATLTGWGARA
ncbi:hypothetical protein IWW45_002156 [Coemansia sp. RSA 485]|nr:hypothetical protein IWW45_002156 [Coemansia sp. RSA 485]